MPLYELVCRICGRSELSRSPVPGRCPCGGLQRRHYSFQFHRPMQEHWNHSVGQPIRTMRQFKDALARKSDEMTERTGVPHDYQPVDLSDREALGVTDEGLEETERRRRAS